MIYIYIYIYYVLILCNVIENIILYTHNRILHIDVHSSTLIYPSQADEEAQLRWALEARFDDDR